MIDSNTVLSGKLLENMESSLPGSSEVPEVHVRSEYLHSGESVGGGGGDYTDNMHMTRRQMRGLDSHRVKGRLLVNENDSLSTMTFDIQSTQRPPFRDNGSQLSSDFSAGSLPGVMNKNRSVSILVDPDNDSIHVGNAELRQSKFDKIVE